MWLSVFLVLSVWCDQALKLAVTRRLHQNESIPVIDGYLHITLVYNTGSAFGLFRGWNWLLTYLSLAAIVVILYFMAARPQFRSPGYLRMWRGALLLILSGATGNLIDRLRLGYVIDFIDLRVWPVFNLADIMISSGVLLLLIVFFSKKALG